MVRARVFGPAKAFGFTSGGRALPANLRCWFNGDDGGGDDGLRGDSCCTLVSTRQQYGSLTSHSTDSVHSHS